MKLKLMAGLLGALLVVTGCSADDGKSDSSKEEKPVEQANDKNVNATDTKQDVDLTKKVLEEKGVTGGQVYEQNGTAIGVLILDKDVTDADVKKLADKYASEIKKEYKDLPVNVQAIRDGENVANVNLD